MEIYTHACGYQPRVDSFALHARKRYRLVSIANANANLPTPDPSLWIVHYSHAEEQDRLPVARIPVTPQLHSLMGQREVLRQHGQLVRKEFMLYDRNNWPTVNMPNSSNSGQSWPAMAYPNNVISQMNRNQHPFMMPQQTMNQVGLGPSPAKRARQMGPGHAHGSIRAAPQLPQTSSLDDEDMISGDAMDTLTPRAISSHRFMQHHNWMDEVFSSPYGTSQIIPVELGLGRKGELESLTQDFYSAPTNDLLELPKNEVVPPRVGRLAPGKSNDFNEQATHRVREIHAEMERLKKQHARRMAKLTKGLAVTEAEQKLKALSLNVRDKNGPSQLSNAKLKSVDELLSRVEAELGRNIKTISEISCVQKGGLVEKSEVSDAGLRSFDFEGMADFGDQQIPSTTFPTPQQLSSRGYGSAMHTPHDFSIQPLAGDGAQETEQTNASPSQGTTMVRVPSDSAAKDAGSGDWIMVEKGDEADGQVNQATPDVEDIMNDTAMENNLETPSQDLDTAGEALQDFAPDTAADPAEDFNPNDFGDAVDFGSLDTAGEALSGYAENADMGLDEPADLGLDDSAFGEAFHATEASGETEKPGGEA